ncbi:Uma2 family endonuclease [Kamptonema sp. UHCC 0994]|uniref:Uma2 family endonuclease n=1 Tax=Kamptonema sp. UHCC 0994 TaxID=3031329 RepID=UPI0023B90263|nr:Uma2 family endonuclease [Kamptonema sp. UHCC 0994]MDF0554646.1 Uma2 family endonuclease [Kamptonema sp. UHCC 0994]
MTTLISQFRQGAIANEFPKWIPATWEDYLVYRDDPTSEKVRLFFNGNYLFVDDMSGEGINHASIARLFAMLFCFWFNRFSEQTASDLGGCLIEKPNTRAASPDLVLYIGEGVPQWQEGEPRRINLNQWRVPDLVGEVGDTTLATDLDEKKKLYADLGIPEYWAIDVKGKRVFAFRLQSTGNYAQIQESVALEGLPIALLEETLERLNQGTNISAAGWFAQAIASLSAE